MLKVWKKALPGNIFFKSINLFSLLYIWTLWNWSDKYQILDSLNIKIFKGNYNNNYLEEDHRWIFNARERFDINGDKIPLAFRYVFPTSHLPSHPQVTNAAKLKRSRHITLSLSLRTGTPLAWFIKLYCCKIWIIYITAVCYVTNCSFYISYV